MFFVDGTYPPILYVLPYDGNVMLNRFGLNSLESQRFVASVLFIYKITNYLTGKWIFLYLG